MVIHAVLFAAQQQQEQQERPTTPSLGYAAAKLEERKNSKNGKFAFVLYISSLWSSLTGQVTVEKLK